MDAVTQSEPAEPPSAEIIDLAVFRKARDEAREAVPRPADPFPWAYTFGAPERG
jgi:hypothetical protein